MASGPTNSILLPILLLLSISTIAAARPCKTIFFITTTTTTTSLYPSSSHHNPNFPLIRQQNPNQYLTLFVTEFHRLPNKPYPRRYEPIFFQDDVVLEKKTTQNPRPFQLYSSVSSSIRDRTMDIMSIVGALLFGVGCGALTAATMYLIWSLFSPRRFDLGDSSDDDDDDYEDDVSPKKMGYVAIPAGAVTTETFPAATATATATAPAPAKEV